jgi:hypothetical protein
MNAGRGAEKGNRRDSIHRVQFQNAAGKLIRILFLYGITRLVLKTLVTEWCSLVCITPTYMQNIKAVFDAAIKVVLQPPKQRRR